jgi:hypothetical protein
LKRAKEKLDAQTERDDRALFDLEEGFLLDYPDKMVFLAKEMKSYSHNDKSPHLSPSIIAHLNLDTVDNHEFIDPDQVEEFTQKEDLTIEALIQRSMKLAASVPSEQSRLRREQKILNEDITEIEKNKKLKILR